MYTQYPWESRYKYQTRILYTQCPWASKTGHTFYNNSSGMGRKVRQIKWSFNLLLIEESPPCSKLGLLVT